MHDSARAWEDLLARLLTDADCRARFKRDPVAMACEFGLDASQIEALDRTDWVGLELAARSYAHKRKARSGAR